MPRQGKESKRGSGGELRAWGPPAPPGAPGPRTYLLAAAAAGVGLGVRRRAAAAPGRGVKVPGIILVHDPRWGPERKQGVFLSPPWPRPRTGCCALARCGLRLGCSLRSPGFSPTAAARTGRRRHPGTVAPARRALHFFPARPAPRDPVPPSNKSARPSVPPLRAPSRPRAQSEPSRDRRFYQKLEIRKEGEPGQSRQPGLRTPDLGQGKRRRKRKAARSEKLLFPPFRKDTENKLPVANAPPEFRSGSDTWLGEGSPRPSRSPWGSSGEGRGPAPGAGAAARATGPAPLPGRPLPDRPASPSASLSLPLSPPSTARLLAGSLGAPVLCPR